MQNDDTSDVGKSTDTTPPNETQQEMSPPTSGASGAISKKRLSGRGLYITAIVLGVIIVILLALYIFLALTYKRPAHTSIAPLAPISRTYKLQKAGLSIVDLLYSSPI